VVDPINWERLIFHLHGECEIYESDPIKAERMCVTVFTGIYTQWSKRWSEGDPH
jgi:hypothetical protein